MRYLILILVSLVAVSSCSKDNNKDTDNQLGILNSGAWKCINVKGYDPKESSLIDVGDIVYFIDGDKFYIKDHIKLTNKFSGYCDMFNNSKDKVVVYGEDKKLKMKLAVLSINQHRLTFFTEYQNASYDGWDYDFTRIY